MTITESRVKDGTLKLGPTGTEFDVSCQVTNVRINSSYDDDGDAVETLCGDQIAPGRKLGGRSIAGTVIQDFTTADVAGSFIDYCWDNDLTEVSFEYVPNVDGPTITGTCRIEVPSETFGGDVNTRITSDFEFAITTPVTRTPPVVTAASTPTTTTKATDTTAT
jgi:hypothetical protein